MAHISYICVLIKICRQQYSLRAYIESWGQHGLHSEHWWQWLHHCAGGSNHPSVRGATALFQYTISIVAAATRPRTQCSQRQSRICRHTQFPRSGWWCHFGCHRWRFWQRPNGFIVGHIERGMSKFTLELLKCDRCLSLTTFYFYFFLQCEGERNPVKLQMTANAIALMARSLSFDSDFMSPFSVNARRNNIHATGKFNEIIYKKFKTKELELSRFTTHFIKRHIFKCKA